jgi:hypothetical protein
VCTLAEEPLSLSGLKARAGEAPRNGPATPATISITERSLFIASMHQGAFMQATSDRFHSGEPISPIFAEIKLSISDGGSVHHHGRLPCPYPSGTYPFPPSRWPKSSSASARAYVHRLALLNQFGRNGSDSVKFLVGRCAIHFSDEFVELCVLLLPVKHHLPFGHHASVPLLLLVCRLRLARIFGDYRS